MSGEAANELVTPRITYVFLLGETQCTSCSLSPTCWHATCEMVELHVHEIVNPDSH